MQKKRISTIIIIFTVFSLFSNTVSVNAVHSENLKTSSEFENLLVSSNIIRNFEFDKFNNIELNGTNSVYGDKLKFEKLPNFKMSKDDVKLINQYTIGDKQYFHYSVALTNKMNIYTNVKILQASENGLKEQTTNIVVMDYSRLGWFLGLGSTTKQDYMQFTHYDFGNVVNYNALQNNFHGDLEMTFDIDQSPLPNTLTDYEGNTQTQEFSYISLTSAGITSSINGDLSTTMPVIEGLLPSELISEEKNSFTAVQGNVPKEERHWNAKPRLEVYQDPDTIFGEAINSGTVGSGLNPTTKNGTQLWNPLFEESMENGRIKFNVGSISPTIYRWMSTLYYTYTKVTDQEQLFGALIKVGNPEPSYKSITKPSALHVINRYIQFGIKLVFEIYTCFTIEAQDTPHEDWDLGLPTEYYDKLLWSVMTSGTTGGTINNPTGWLQDIFNALANNPIVMLIIGLIIVVVVGWVISKIVKARGNRVRIQTMVQPSGYYPQYQAQAQPPKYQPQPQAQPPKYQPQPQGYNQGHQKRQGYFERRRQRKYNQQRF